jgi:hypothetical protein
MALPARRIPAWKRLGLKLKNDQSGGHTQETESQVEEPQPECSQTVVQRETSNRNTHTPARVDESSSCLGKRKLSAETNGQAIKKRRNSPEFRHPRGDTAQPAAASAQLDNGTVLSDATQSDKPRPKGDPNYRKKKGRKSNQYHEHKSVSAQTDLTPQSSGGQTLENRPGTPSLSPSQLDLASDRATLSRSETGFTASSAVPNKSNTSASNSLSQISYVYSRHQNGRRKQRFQSIQEVGIGTERRQYAVLAGRSCPVHATAEKPSCQRRPHLECHN